MSKIRNFIFENIQFKKKQGINILNLANINNNNNY